MPNRIHRSSTDTDFTQIEADLRHREIRPTAFNKSSESLRWFVAGVCGFQLGRIRNCLALRTSSSKFNEAGRNFTHFGKSPQTKLDAQQFTFTMCRRFSQRRHHPWVVYALRWLSNLTPFIAALHFSAVPTRSGRDLRWCAAQDGTR